MTHHYERVNEEAPPPTRSERVYVDDDEYVDGVVESEDDSIWSLYIKIGLETPIQLDLDPYHDHTVADLKALILSIFDDENLNSDIFIVSMTFEGNHLEDYDRTLSDYNITDKSTII
eukprot:9623573-Heterocapsa_arctica.AAC.1